MYKCLMNGEIVHRLLGQKTCTDLHYHHIEHGTNTAVAAAKGQADNTIMNHDKEARWVGASDNLLTKTRTGTCWLRVFQMAISSRVTRPRFRIRAQVTHDNLDDIRPTISSKGLRLTKLLKSASQPWSNDKSMESCTGRESATNHRKPGAKYLSRNAITRAHLHPPQL